MRHLLVENTFRKKRSFPLHRADSGWLCYHQPHDGAIDLGERFSPERAMRNRAALFGLALIFAVAPCPALAQPAKIKILFLGDNGHHKPQERYRQIAPVLAAHNIRVEYADSPKALNAETLARFDGLLIYANLEKITPEEEQALLDYVAGGKGFIPIHCASYCFLNSPKYVELVGAQFKSHGTGTFRTVTAQSDHPIVRGLEELESWDETYVHHRHNDKDRTVLSYRVDKNGKEPWTWVRTQGKGRVFYTAWGHDERTWGNPEFQVLLERGIRWAVGEDPGVVPAVVKAPEMTSKRTDVKPFEYQEAKVPFYPPGKGGATKAQNQMQLPLEPEESRKHFVTPVQLEPKLFAAEPQIRRPICMNWDERGRLWIAETVDYPNNRQPDGKGNDRIVICEDTDGDGVADKITVFADKLSIPTGFTFYKGGIVVAQAPHTLYLKSSRNDDQADVRQILFSGWGTYDTHAGPSNLRWGFDNWIYGIVGYSGFNGTVGGEQHRFGQGFFRFKMSEPGASATGVSVSKLEFLRSTNNNSWGVGFSEEGLLFGSTANGNPSVYLPIPNRYYESVRGWSSRVLGGIAGNAPMYPITEKVRQVDYHGHFTAAAGHALYTARLYPREYWNRAAFVAEPTGHLVATFQLERRGSDFVSRNAWNLLASDDEWSAPIMAEVGPDGNVWVIDWYNYIVQHNPTPQGYKTGKGNAYDTELRDKTHGRIYRLVAKNAKAAASFTLKNATPDQLVAALKSDNMLWRLHAQRLLVERGKDDVVRALCKLVEDESVDEIGLNVGAIHGLSTLHGLGALDGANLFANRAMLGSLTHLSAAVRRNAVLVSRQFAPFDHIVGSGRLADPDAQVRLATLLAVAEMPEHNGVARGIAEMLGSPENANDRWILDAATSAAARNDLEFLRMIARTKPPPASRVLDVVTVVAEHRARGGSADGWNVLMTTIAGADPTVAEVMLAGFAKGWPRGKTVTLSADAERAMEKMLGTLDPAGKGHLLRLAAAWGSPGLTKYAAEAAKGLLAVIEDDKRGDAARTAAARQLVEFRSADAAVADQLLGLITPRASPALAAGLIDALGGSAAAVGPAIVKRLDSLPPSARAAALRVLLSRTESTRALLDALDKGTAQPGELTLDQKEALASHPDAKIAARAKAILSRGGGLPSADRQKVIDELLPLIKRTGRPDEGKLVFKKHCATCHMHAGDGNKVGPDLTGMATHPRTELLVSIMDPSRSVEGNYRVYTVTLADGRVLNGLLASETKTSVEIIDAQAKKHVVQRDEIDDLKASNKSLMPDGFEKALNAEDLVNLLEFLTQRGQYLPIPLGKAATIASDRGMFYSKDSDVERLIFKDWSPQTFKGVPFHLVDPQGGKVPNVVMLYGPQGEFPPKMPKSVKLPCNSPARAIHLLSGVSGWGFPYSKKGGVTLIVRLHYGDGKTEDHELRNGEHFADYIRRVDVPGSEFAFALRGQQIRYLSIAPKRAEAIAEIELVKGSDLSAPVVMAVTIESR
jgi:putative membrane-bound dehydrogenase-like protein